MNLILYLIIFIFGTCCGSFLNCVIYRLEKKQSFLWGRSFCPNCHHNLGFFDLIPILSFIFLKGKCRYCGQKISYQYPLVEIATGLLLILIFWHLDFGFGLAFGIWILDFLYLLIISCFLIIIFVYDLKHYIIPDRIIYPAITITFLYRIFENFGFNVSRSLGFSLMAAAGAAAFFFLIYFLSQGKWMGFGDVKLAVFMGLFLGWPVILVGLFSAFFIGAIIGLVLIAFGKKTLKSQVPFGPFLVSGTFIALFWAKNLISWYLNL